MIRSALALALAVVACSDSDEGGVPPLVTQAEGEPSTELALVESVLRYDADLNCLYLDGPRRLPVWPHGHRVARDGDELRVVNEGGRLVATVGEPLRAAGGYHEQPDGAEPCGVDGGPDSAVVIGEPIEP